MSKQQRYDSRRAFWQEHLELGAEENLALALEKDAVGAVVLVPLRKQATGHDGPIAVKVGQVRGVGLCLSVIDSEFAPIEPMEHFALPVDSLDYPFLTGEWLDANCADDERGYAIELHKALAWALGRGRYAERTFRNQFGQEKPGGNQGHHNERGRRHDQCQKNKGATTEGYVPAVEQKPAFTATAGSTVVSHAKTKKPSQSGRHGTLVGHGLDALAFVPSIGEVARPH